MAEKNLFKNLKSQSIEDGYRRFHGFKKNDYSFEIIRKGKIISRRRFDHFFVSAEIEINNIEYLHNYRLQKLSDHSPIQMDFTI